MPVNALNSNVYALPLVRILRTAADTGARLHEQIASGRRINRAGDDAAGLAMSKEMGARIASLQQARRNAGDGLSMLQIADDGLQSMSSTLARMRELAVANANGTMTDAQRAANDAEFTQLKASLDDVAGNTSFNGTNLLNGDLSGGVDVQVGIHGTANDQVSVALNAVTVNDLSLTATNVATQGASTTAIAAIDAALDTVGTELATVGASESRLSSATSYLSSTILSETEAHGRIVDVDMGAASTALAANAIQLQTVTGLLAQTSGLDQSALVLINSLFR